MAKKAVGKVKSGKKNMAKVIVPIRSKKTGAYTFSKRIMPIEEAQTFLSK